MSILIDDYLVIQDFVEKNFDNSKDILHNLNKIDKKYKKIKIDKLIEDLNDIVMLFIEDFKGISVESMIDRHMIYILFIFVKNLILLKKGFSYKSKTWIYQKYRYYFTDKDFQSIFKIMEHIHDLDEKIYFDSIKNQKAIFCFALSGIKTRLNVWWNGNLLNEDCNLPLSNFYIDGYYFNTMKENLKEKMKDHIDMCCSCSEKIELIKKFEKGGVDA